MRLADLDTPYRLAITMFLVVCAAGAAAIGVMVAAGAPRAAAWQALSPRAAWLRHTASPLERAVRGDMQEHIRSDADPERIVEWVRNGARRDAYYRTVAPILEHCCFSCHGKAAARSGMISLYTYADVQPYATSRGEALAEVAKRAHVHVLGLAPLLLALALLVAATSRSRSVKLALQLSLFGSLLIDTLGQFLARANEFAAYVVWAAGLCMALSATAAAALVLWEMWRPRTGATDL